MKKTTNKGFSMVELIIVIAIMAILAAALAPSLIKYINKSRLSTDIQTGTSIVSAATAAMAVEAANNDATAYASWTDVNTVLGAAGSNSFASEFANVMGVASVKGKSTKDISSNTITGNGTFYMQIDSKGVVSVIYGDTGNSGYLLAPTTGSSMTQ